MRIELATLDSAQDSSMFVRARARNVRKVERDRGEFHEPTS
jgi:hypothetical protein